MVARVTTPAYWYIKLLNCSISLLIVYWSQPIRISYTLTIITQLILSDKKQYTIVK